MNPFKQVFCCLGFFFFQYIKIKIAQSRYYLDSNWNFPSSTSGSILFSSFSVKPSYLFMASYTLILVYVVYSVFAPASLKHKLKRHSWFPRLFFVCASLFISFCFYCFVYACKQPNIIFPQNCLIRVSSWLRSLTAPVSFKSSPAKLSQEHGMVGHLWSFVSCL